MKTPKSDVKRVLVVEDEPAISTICQRVLTGEGFEVDIAVNGKVAQDMLEKKQYDLYLLDIKLPVLNDKEVHHYFQSNNTTNYPSANIFRAEL